MFTLTKARPEGHSDTMSMCRFNETFEIKIEMKKKKRKRKKRKP